MAANGAGDFIRSVFSTMVDRGGDVFRALFADADGSGTVERAFSEFEKTRKAWEVESASPYDQRGEQLEKTLWLFSALERLKTDTDETVLRRLALLFKRNGDTVWGDKWDTLKIFKSFFGTEKVWLVNNTDDFSRNLLANGDFENETGWVFDGAAYDRAAGFEGAKGALLDKAGGFWQAVPLKADTVYFLHFFLKGRVNVEVESGGRFWNPRLGEFGGWAEKENSFLFETDEWDCESLFFITGGGAQSARIRFSYAEKGRASVDFVMLNEKTKASTFSVIALFEGKATTDTASYAPGTKDPIRAFNYDRMGYFSPGGYDARERNMEALSWYDQSTVANDRHPVMDSVKEDFPPRVEGEYESFTYLDGEMPALSPESPTGKEGPPNVDYGKMSYYNEAHIFGAGGNAMAKRLYQGILDLIQPAGVSSMIELLTKIDG